MQYLSIISLDKGHIFSHCQTMYFSKLQIIHRGCTYNEQINRWSLRSFPIQDLTSLSSTDSNVNAQTASLFSFIPFMQWNMNLEEQGNWYHKVIGLFFTCDFHIMTWFSSLTLYPWEIQWFLTYFTRMKDLLQKLWHIYEMQNNATNLNVFSKCKVIESCSCETKGYDTINIGDIF
jgi:hypothetical protein